MTVLGEKSMFLTKAFSLHDEVKTKTLHSFLTVPGYFSGQQKLGQVVKISGCFWYLAHTKRNFKSLHLISVLNLRHFLKFK